MNNDLNILYNSDLSNLEKENSTNKIDLNKNLRNIYIFKFFKSFMITNSVASIFYKENGLNSTEILTLGSIYSITMVLSEIPSGYISDSIGRRKAIIFSALLSFLAYSVFSFSSTFFYFSIVHILLALSTSLSSGSDSALLYDNLQELNKKQTYKKNESNLLSVESFSEATASILGGLIAFYLNKRFNIYSETFVLFLALITSFLIKEVRKNNKIKLSPKESFYLLKNTFKENNNLKWFILYSAIISCSTLTFASLIQFYLKSISLEIVFFGLVFASLRYSVTIFSMFTDKVESFLGEKYTLISFPLLAFIAFIAIAIFKSVWAISIFFIIYFLRAFNKPILKNYIQGFVSNDIRATILSLPSSLCRIIYFPLAPTLGYITDKYSLSNTFLFAGFFHLFFALIPLYFLINEKKKVI
ncbi:MAG: MFS transporter [Candidatus Sericytochromatia bacterium]